MSSLAIAPLVHALQEVIRGMAEVRNIGVHKQKTDEEEEHQRKINLILTIIGVGLLFVPFIGQEVASALDRAQLADIIALGGELADGVLIIYSTVEDPSSGLISTSACSLTSAASRKRHATRRPRATSHAKMRPNDQFCCCVPSRYPHSSVTGILPCAEAEHDRRPHPRVVGPEHSLDGRFQLGVRFFHLVLPDGHQS